MKTIMWFREDLRLFDNPALWHAAKSGDVLAIYFHPKGLGAASYWWLHHSLENLMASLARQNITLILSSKDPTSEIPRLCENIGADKVVWNRVYSPSGIDVGKKLKNVLQKKAIACESFNGQLLVEPSSIKTKEGKPYKVFTPFWKKCMEHLNPKVSLEVPVLTGIDLSNGNLSSESLASWNLKPLEPNWACGFAEQWQPGEEGASQLLYSFLDSKIHGYSINRDYPAMDSTSLLSPHLCFGEISARHIWHQVHQALSSGQFSHADAKKFLAELGWREFSRYLIVHFPFMLSAPFNQNFDRFPWQHNDKLLKAWQQGKTGYPIVDAGMRELWQTGYMHNRVRMLAASFLTKHCLIHWQVGMNWFWDTLVDADIANNTASWQWVSGAGADAAPFFRIFNPVIQGERFDKNGHYIRRWLPELKRLPNKYIHQPWQASESVLQEADLILDENYPAPIVDHKHSRDRALAAYRFMRDS